MILGSVQEVQRHWHRSMVIRMKNSKATSQAGPEEARDQGYKSSDNGGLCA